MRGGGSYENLNNFFPGRPVRIVFGDGRVHVYIRTYMHTHTHTLYRDQKGFLQVSPDDSSRRQVVGVNKRKSHGCSSSDECCGDE